MPKRFLTAEDVHRAQGAEIQVEPETVVTPQAQAAADARGLVIRTSQGTWTEPTPDRGPDAERSTRSLPHLPEPSAGPGDEAGFVVTVVGRDRAGILAEVTSAISAFGGNVQDISQKTVEGYFHLILTVTLPARVTFGDAKSQLECLGSGDYVVRVMHERVFRFMHRI